MKNSIIYITLIILLGSLCSCSLEEAYTPVTTEGTVEFVPRLTNFNGVNIGTKAGGDNGETLDVETAIYNAFLLLFKPDGKDEGAGDLISLIEINTDAQGNAYPQKVPTRLFEGLESITACYIANVPKTFVAGIDNISKLSDAVLELQYPENSIGVPPLLDRDNNPDTDNNVHAIPMFGMDEIAKPNIGAVSEIHVKRLFAKVIVNISVSMTSGLLQSPDAFYDFKSYTLANVPKRVNLKSIDIDEDNSSWFTGGQDGSFAEKLTISVQNGKVYDTDADDSKKKSHTFSFYVPEYILQPTEYKDATYESDKENQKYKPSLIPQGALPISLTINGILRDNNNQDTSVSYIIYLGGDAYDDFRSLRNTCYTHNIKIMGTDHITDDEASVETPPLNLVDMYGQSANCYIISNTGRYQLDTYKGVIKNITSSTPKLRGTPKTTPIWNVSENVITIITEDGATNEDKIIFTVNGDTPGGDVSVGNALLALTDDKGNILWSWHIWFNESDNRADLEENLDKYPSDDGKWNSFYMMNRALGATSAIDLDFTGLISGLNGFLWRDGLYYQWGRKDPMRSSSINLDELEENAPYENSILNPTTLYSGWEAMSDTEGWEGWTNDKSTDDPCPPGYRVPSSSVWRGQNPDQSASLGDFHLTTTIAYTYHLQDSSNDGTSTFVFYPYQGYLTSSGNIDLDEVDTAFGDYPHEVLVDVPNWQIGKEISWSDILSMISGATVYRCRRIKYKYDYTYTHSYLWATDKSLLWSYGRAQIDEGWFTSDNNIAEYVVNSGNLSYREERIQTGSFFGVPIYTTKYYYNGPKWNNDDRKVTNPTLVDAFTGFSEVNNAVKNYLKGQSISSHMYQYDNPEIDMTKSCQIRCVKE